MSRKVLKGYNRFIAAIFSILGIGAGFLGCEPFATAYGLPTADFKIIGKVTAQSTQTAINNIRVELQNDTTYTNESGEYEITSSQFPDDTVVFPIKFTDIDGSANGEYQEIDTNITFVNPVYKNGDGKWYIGEVTKELNLKLKEDKQ
ncbi:MAG: radical SAM-associated putative lipoprotein [Bacteroidales bacterium]|nr:radical SAM-associated putative lipoprotein [Bacteroidales bacterium]MBN2818926.1 radical SAM-associated putative lipoprotein [Bacteroidales bacterium]